MKCKYSSFKMKLITEETFSIKIIQDIIHDHLVTNTKCLVKEAYLISVIRRLSSQQFQSLNIQRSSSDGRKKENKN